MSLFNLGTFQLHSGEQSHWKIDCDCLTDEDIKTIAFMLWERLPKFGSVIGIPNGGLRLAEEMSKYSDGVPTLIVDDVLTTGSSMVEYKKLVEENTRKKAIGCVIFARGCCPDWVYSLFTLNE